MQESLAQQMTGSLFNRDGDALFSGNKKNPKKIGADCNSSSKENENKKGVKCYWCGKLGHIKKNCQVKLKGRNVAEKDGGENED